MGNRWYRWWHRNTKLIWADPPAPQQAKLLHYWAEIAPEVVRGGWVWKVMDKTETEVWEVAKGWETNQLKAKEAVRRWALERMVMPT